jgi:hypothetical protein
MALSERENLILLQLEQSLRTDGREHARRRIAVAVTTAAAALGAVALITWAALAPASAGTVAATGVAGVLHGGLAFCYRVQAQAPALRLYGAASQRLRNARPPLRRRKQP